ncbi:MAG: hypothetical protein ACM3MG_01915 [Bacillota bacterium]
MKKCFSFLYLFLNVVLLSSCAIKEKQIPRDIASLQASGGMEGIWFLQGTSSIRGPYNGELELRKSHDGTYDAIRVITYINYFYDGLKVQEVWTGKAIATGDMLTLSYDLRQADFIAKMDSQKRDKNDFKRQINVIARFALSDKGLATQFSDKKVSNYTEWITTRRDLDPKPLWLNARAMIDASGPKMPLPVRAVIKAFKADIGYDRDPFVKSFKNRKEFQDERPSIIFDPTDYEFYRNNKDIIRVVNKVTDDISITEASVKRNAYSPSLGEKARGYDKNTVSNHINQLGVVSQAVVDPDGNLVSYDYDSSAAMWTGLYVGSQAMRYLTSKNPEALENVKKSLKGIFMLVDVTDDPKQFARSVRAYDPAQPIPEGWHQGTGVYRKILWLEGGNNDMIKGIIHALMWASIVVPHQDIETWEHLRDISRRLLDLNVMNEKSQNRGPALGLALLIDPNSGLHEQYVKAYEGWKKTISGYNFDSTFYWRGSADWSGINLGLVGDISAIVIADRLGESKIRDQLRERLMDTWVTYSPVQRPLVTMVAYGFAYSQGTRGDKFLKESSEEKFRTAVDQSIWGLREIPYPRPNLDVEIDHSLNPEWCISPIPYLFWKALKKPEPPIDYFYQGLYSYPVFEQGAFTSNYIWKDSAFQYKGSHKKGLESPGVDYLYAYWLARYVGLLNLE